MKISLSLKLNYYFILFSASLLVILPTVFLNSWLIENAQQQRSKSVELQLEILLKQLNNNLQRHLQIVGGLPSLFVLNPDLSQQQFGFAVKHLIGVDSEIRNIAAAPDLVIKFMYPIEGNEAAIGLDYTKNKAQFTAVEKAIETDQIVLAGPLNLVQGGKGLIARFPVTLPDENGNMQFWGILSSVIDADKFFRLSLGSNSSGSIKLAIRGKDGSGEQGEVFYGDPLLFESARLTRQFQLPVGSWFIVAEPIEGWETLPASLNSQRLSLYIAAFIIWTLLVLSIRFLYNHQLSNYRFRKLIDDSSLPYLFLDKNNKVSYINTAFTNAFGYSFDALSKMSSWANITNNISAVEAFVDIKDLPISTSQDEVTKPSIEVEIKTINGLKKSVLLNRSVILKHDIHETIVSIFDISDRKQVEQQLLENNHQLAASQALWKTIFETLPDLLWMKDPNGVYLTCNSEFEAFFGEKQHNIIGKTDYDFVDAELADFFRKNDLIAIQNNRPSMNEERLVYASDGRVIDVETVKTPVFSDDGELIGVLGISHDITEKKRSHESLKLASLVFESSSEAMAVTNSSAVILDVNPSFCLMTGYSKDELIGNNIRILQSGKQNKAFYKQMYDALATTGKWEGELHNKRKNGDIYPQLLTINAIFGENDEIVQYVALARDVSEHYEVQQKIWRQAHYDSLTGLANRLFLTEYLEKEIHKAARYNYQLATLFLDLDGFKDVNDSFGHEVGDKLLIAVAERLLKAIRQDDVLARQGGDEFILVTSNIDNIEAPVLVAQKIIQQCNQPFLIDGNWLHITVSVGISVYPDDGLDNTQLLKAADQAMYAAKNAGKNRYATFRPSMQRNIDQRVQLINELHIAYHQQQFELFYQPIVCIKTGKLMRAEALIRWNHPQRGMVPPADFIPLVEESKLVADIGYWVFETVCASINQCKPIFGDDFKISLNLSPAQLLYEQYHPISWPQQLQNYHITAKDIVIEITEGLLMGGADKTTETLNVFRDTGIEVAIDDFGTGYSSLAYIRDYDIDYLKIDREFVKRIAEDDDAYTLCEAIVVMAHKLGIKVIAEGVETNSQRELLEQMGCNYAQGYFFSKPVPLEQFFTLPKRFEL